MEQPWTTLGLAVVLFVSTNVDDVFVLLALFSDPSLTPGRIVVGHCLGMLALVLASVAGSVLALAIAPAYVGLLGLAPLGIGLFQLVQRWRGARHDNDDDDDDDDDDEGVRRVDRTRAAAQVFAVILITIASGGDNLAVYIPAFTTRRPVELWMVGSVFMLLTLVWCWMGYAFVKHPRLGAPIRRYAGPLTPWVFIALGVFILVEAFS